MLKYIFKRILFAALALLILLVLVFFLMQAIPGYPLRREQTWTDQQYLEHLQTLGLLENPIVQFFKFIGGIFQGEFGTVYNSNGQSVVQTALVPMQYTIMVAVPAFILSAVLGIGFGVLSACYRGKWVDTLINIIAVLFLAIPSFIFALYLIKLAGLIGLPTSFIAPGSGPIAQVIASMIMPILSMTLASISVILYYTRNELVDVFKQDYIKTALAKGISFRKIIFTHALRNALIPILAALLPSFLSILTGSIIIETFFNIPGSSRILINAIQDKEIYIVVFSTLFYSGIYFLLQILVDISFTFIDPRIKLATNNNISLFQRIKNRIKRQQSKQELLSSNYSYFKDNIVFNTNVNNSLNVGQIDLLSGASEYSAKQILSMQNSSLPTRNEINLAKDMIPVQTQITENYELSSFVQTKIKNDSFKQVLNYSHNNEQIVGKPTTYIKDVFKRFFKSKTAIVFTILLGIIFLLSIIIPLATPNSTNVAIGGLHPSLTAYLPPRIPLLGMNGIVSEYVVNSDTYQLLLGLKEKFPDLFTGVTELSNGSFALINYNPYVLPELKNLYLFMGTDGLGRDWSSMLWYATAKSLVIAIIASFGSTLIGTIYGAVAGSFAGKATDTIMMRIVEIISGVPLIVWVLIISMVVSGGSLDIFTICFTLIITSWMGSAVVARTFVMKYKDSEFVQAAQTLGASRTRIIFSHLLPNIIGRLLVVFVNKIPVIIFFETSLVFLGLKSTSEVSLGTMINTAWQDGYWWLLLGPTFNLVLTTLSSIIIANNLNDAIDPQIVG
ncbi:MAG: ABC transporter permease subunit [Ureaplasma sp.]|nr:ABC transporter permease subunit [Ureaplasma sp.]